MSSDVRNDRRYNLLCNGVRIPVRLYGGSRIAEINCKVVGEYYVGADRTVELGRQKARHYCPPPTEDFRFDLNDGFENWTDWTGGHSEHLDIFQKWFLKMAEEGHSIAKVLDGVNVVIGRGILRRIATTPTLFSRVNWRVIAQKRNGIIFIYSEDEEHDFDGASIYVYHGFSFETFVTCGENECSPGSMETVKGSEQFRTVCRFEVSVDRKKYNFLVTGEIDALDEDGYVELKTAYTGRMDDEFLTYAKCIHTWLQCTLVGVEKVVVGYKDDRGFVEKIKEMPKNDLVTKMSTAGRIDTNQNFLFLHRLVEQMDGKIQEGESCAVSFEASGRHAVLTRLPEADSVLFEEFKKMLDDM